MRAALLVALTALLVPALAPVPRQGAGSEMGPGDSPGVLTANITVDVSKSGPAISPGLFGQNGAVWMSMNQTVVDLTNRSGATVIRWPGGETTDYYDWEADGGLGRVYRDDGSYWSPVRSTDTFIDFCRKTSCTPMVSANAVIADPQKAARWARYFINKSLPVKLWQVGNEPVFDKHWNVSLPSFRTSDNFQPTSDEWAWATREYAKALRAVDPEIKFIGPDGGAAEGSRDDVWVGEFVRKAWDTIDYVDIHSYPANGMNEADMLATPDSGPDGGLVSRIRKAKAMIAGNSSGKELPLAMTEYNSDWNNGALMGSWVNGLFIAEVLLHLAEENVTIANMWNLASQNEGYIDPNGVPRSSWWAFKMLREQFSGTVVEATSDAVANGYGLEAFAARRDDRALVLAVINKKNSTAYDATIILPGFDKGAYAPAYVLDRTSNYMPGPPAWGNGSAFTYRFEPYSLTILILGERLTLSPSATPFWGTVPFSVTFRVNHSGGVDPLRFMWYFSDGTTATGEVANHTFTSTGVHQNRVEAVSGIGEMRWANISVIAEAPLTVKASAAPTSGTAPILVRFDATVGGASGAVAYTWDFGDGGFDIIRNPTHTYANAGNFTAEVTVQDTAGRRTSDSVLIRVTGPPPPPPPPPPPVPPPAPTDLTGTWDGFGISLSWKHPWTNVTFVVYRKEGAGWTNLTPTPLSARSYRDTAVSAGKNYTYVVTAISESGLESPDSGPATVSVPPLTPPPDNTTPPAPPALLIIAAGVIIVLAVIVAAAVLLLRRRRGQ